jgi:hypothetical protein
MPGATQTNGLPPCRDVLAWSRGPASRHQERALTREGRRQVDERPRLVGHADVPAWSATDRRGAGSHAHWLNKHEGVQRFMTVCIESDFGDRAGHQATARTDRDA